jgi:hypothetical protein
VPRALVGAGLLFAILGPAAAMAPAHVQDPEKGCNVRLKGLKTLSDPQRKIVNLHPKNTTAAVINALPQPHPTPKTRSSAFSRRVWRVTGQITEFKRGGDSGIHLVLFDANSYLIAEMPAAQCLPKKTEIARQSSPHARSSRRAAVSQPTTGRSSAPSRLSAVSASSTFPPRRSRTRGTSPRCIR